jgi:hypothetical protein
MVNLIVDFFIRRCASIFIDVTMCYWVIVLLTLEVFRCGKVY